NRSGDRFDTSRVTFARLPVTHLYENPPLAPRAPLAPRVPRAALYERMRRIWKHRWWRGRPERTPDCTPATGGVFADRPRCRLWRPGWPRRSRHREIHGLDL